MLCSMRVLNVCFHAFFVRICIHSVIVLGMIFFRLVWRTARVEYVASVRRYRLDHYVFRSTYISFFVVELERQIRIWHGHAGRQGNLYGRRGGSGFENITSYTVEVIRWMIQSRGDQWQKIKLKNVVLINDTLTKFHRLIKFLDVLTNESSKRQLLKDMAKYNNELCRRDICLRFGTRS